MAPPLLSSASTFLFLVFALFVTIPYATARLHAALFSASWWLHPSEIEHGTAKSQYIGQSKLHTMQRSGKALLISKVMKVGEQDDTGGVIRATPARDMPAYKQRVAPTPLPEFPTLGPPIVWSFPATPLPAVEAAPPPQDIPAMPKTGSKNGPPPACGGREGYPINPINHPRLPPSVPYVAAEPASMPGPMEAPEGAPQPTAGGPVLPPY
ncbi:hypothetical protein L7F22_016084 [Adiantum nelumboides]|nr:hypothetical protein [Adiantum nelumboides]